MKTMNDLGEKKLVVVRCVNCKQGLPYREGVSSHLRCTACGGLLITFNKVVERTCEACGYIETIHIGEEVKAYHTTGHVDCVLKVIEPLSEDGKKSKQLPSSKVKDDDEVKEEKKPLVKKKTQRKKVGKKKTSSSVKTEKIEEENPKRKLKRDAKKNGENE